MAPYAGKIIVPDTNNTAMEIAKAYNPSGNELSFWTDGSQPKNKNTGCSTVWHAGGATLRALFADQKATAAILKFLNDTGL